MEINGGGGGVYLLDKRLPVMVTTITQRATFRNGAVSNEKPSAPCHTYATNCHSKYAINDSDDLEVRGLKKWKILDPSR